VLIIVVIMTSVVAVGYNEFRGRLSLERAADKMAQDIRKALELSISSPEPPVEGSVSDFRGGYGIYFDEEEDNYMAVAHTHPGQYDRDYVQLKKSAINPLDLEKEGLEIKEVTLENCHTSPTENLVVFFPPDPLVYIGNHVLPMGEGQGSRCDKLKVVLSIKEREEEKEVIVNKRGLVKVK